jgi:hypothetical protein
MINYLVEKTGYTKRWNLTKYAKLAGLGAAAQMRCSGRNAGTVRAEPSEIIRGLV